MLKNIYKEINSEDILRYISDKLLTKGISSAIEKQEINKRTHRYVGDLTTETSKIQVIHTNKSVYLSFGVIDDVENIINRFYFSICDHFIEITLYSSYLASREYKYKKFFYDDIPSSKISSYIKQFFSELMLNSEENTCIIQIQDIIEEMLRGINENSNL